MSCYSQPLFVLLLVAFVFLAFFQILYWLYAKRNKEKGPAFSLASLLLCFLLFCALWDEVMEDFSASVTALLFYLVLILISKFTLSRIILGKTTINRLKFFKLFCLDIQYLALTPDYVITKLCKDVFWQTRYEKRASIIRFFNGENLAVSFLTVFLFSIFSYANFFDCYFLRRFMLAFLGVRVVSRTLEISMSFVKDVCFSKHGSNLTSRGRVGLAFLSILEVLILSFGVSYCVPTDHSISRAAIEAISIIQNAPSGNPIDGTFIMKVFSSLSCFSLLGIVIGSYLGDKKEE